MALCLLYGPMNMWASETVWLLCTAFYVGGVITGAIGLLAIIAFSQHG